MRLAMWVLPVPGRPTRMMTSLSEAVAPTTSRGVALTPSGITWGVGLSILGFSGMMVVVVGLGEGGGVGLEGVGDLECGFGCKALLLVMRPMDSRNSTRNVSMVTFLEW